MDVVFLISILVRVAVTSEITPRIEIMDRVIVNQNLTLPCSIKMPSHSGLLQWFFKAHDSEIYKIVCVKKPNENECTKSNIAEPWLENFQTSTDSVVIDRVSPQHSGTYQCKYMDLENNKYEKFNIEVNILTPPGKPKIQSTPPTFVEDQHVTLICESHGGNPKPSLKWIWKDFSNKPIPKRSIISHNLTQTDTIYGLTVLTIVWLPKSFDDGNSISCLAENSLAAASSNWMYLNVNYAPIVYDIPTSPHFVLLGSEINIECKASGKSAANFKWWSDKNVTISDTAQLIIKSISKTHKGSYRCSVTNPFGTSSAIVNITVLSSPVIELAQDLVVVEGEILRTVCQVIPFFSNVSWWMNTKCVSSTRLLEISFVGVKPVELQCRATVLLNKYPGRHVLASNAKSLNVTVQYQPRKPAIAVHPVGSLVIGMDVTITCVPDIAEPGFPKPDYCWQRSNSRWTKNNTNFLSFSSLSFNDSGVYVCNLFNSIGISKETSYNLMIYGQPHLIDPTVQSPSPFKVKEGLSFSMVCHFQAFPPPEITWFNDDVVISSLQNISGHRLQQEQTSINAFKSILHVESSYVKSNEMYRCLATNKYGTLHHEYSIQVQYPPRLLSNIFMVAADSVGQSPSFGAVFLNCTVYGSPKMIITWFRKLANNNENAIENSTERHFILEKHQSNIVDSIMFIRAFENEDYGRYYCMAKNTEGHLEIEFEIKRLSIPDPSHDLILFRHTWNSLSFRWIPGFDGGYPQTFLVSYLTNMQKNPTQVRTSQPNVTLTYLLPDTFYTVAIISSNMLGTTQATLSVKVKTEAINVAEDKVLNINKEDQVLEIMLPLNLSASIFCLTIEEMSNIRDLVGSWSILRRCLRDSFNRLQIESVVSRFRVRVCLITLPDVCSSPIVISSVPDTSDSILSTKLIGTVAAACTVLVILLAILLFFILIRTRRLLPGILNLKDMKRNRKTSRGDLSNYISKPVTSICPNKHGILTDSGGFPLLNKYSCEPVHLTNSPIEIFNVCSTHNIFNEGLYSTLVKSNSINMFSNDVSTTHVVSDSAFINQSSCCCHNDQQMYTMPLPSDNTTTPDKIYYEVMV